MYYLNTDNINRMLNDVYKELDVPPELLKDATTKYHDLGKWLNTDSQANFKTDSLLYVQGSTLLGTSIKPVKRGDEYDFDLVYRRELSKDGITQAELKKQVGDQLKRYIKHLKDSGAPEIPELHECQRCWRLQYKGKFHMDILPAIPDPEPNYKMNPADGVIITDKEASLWQFTNPKGYHAWFKQQMRVALLESRRSLAKAGKVDIEAVPEDEAKTTLQQAIQILKRHRDSTYTGHKDDKPISIIINTLAAHAYNNSDNLYSALSHAVENMAKHIENRQGVLWVQNPINDKENFADKWKNHPERAKAFTTWLNSAQAEFTSFKKETNMQQLSEQLTKSLRVENASKIAEAAHKRAGLAAAASAVTVKTSPWST